MGNTYRGTNAQRMATKRARPPNDATLAAGLSDEFQDWSLFFSTMLTDQQFQCIIPGLELKGKKAFLSACY